MVFEQNSWTPEEGWGEFERCPPVGDVGSSNCSLQRRERAQLKLKDETILDLEEQTKDFKFSIKLHKSIEKNDDVKGGTLGPLPTVSDSGAKSKRSSRTSKRRN